MSASASASSSFDLADLGWDDGWSATLATATLGSFTSLPRGNPADVGRVGRVDIGACTVLSAEGTGRATVPPGTVVAVGDWVLVHQGVVSGALPRRTAIVRRSAGLDPKAQTLAANVDTVLVLVAADGRVTPRSVERYVTLVWESGAVPVVVLTKADLVSGDDLDGAVERLEPACVGVPLHVISAETGTGLDDLAPYLGPGRTVALLGSSGAGKSTLANHLTGAGLATGAVRAGDSRGRHTTTHRELVPIPGGQPVELPAELAPAGEALLGNPPVGQRGEQRTARLPPVGAVGEAALVEQGGDFWKGPGDAVIGLPEADLP